MVCLVVVPADATPDHRDSFPLYVVIRKQPPVEPRVICKALLKALCHEPAGSENGHLSHAHAHARGGLLLHWNGSVDFKNHGD